MIRSSAIIGIVVFNFVLLYIGATIADSGHPGAGLLLVGACVILQKAFYDSRPRRCPDTWVKAYPGAQEADHEFAPTHYYRMVRRVGWRDVVLELDDAIYIPDAEVVPVEFMVYDDFQRPYKFLHGYVVRFEYRGRVMTGQFHGDI